MQFRHHLSCNILHHMYPSSLLLNEKYFFSSEFIHWFMLLNFFPTYITPQVTRVHEEFFLPGEVIMEQGNVVDQLYFVCHGVLVRHSNSYIVFHHNTRIPSKIFYMISAFSYWHHYFI